MKPLNRFKYWIMTAVALPLIGIGCMEIVEIIHPEDAKVNSDIDISVKIKFTAETDHRSEIAFAITIASSESLYATPIASAVSARSSLRPYFAV